MTTTFETTDLETAHQFLCNCYGQLRLTAADGPHHIRVTQHTLGPMRLDRTTFRMRFDVEGPPAALIGFGRVAGGTVTYHSGREHRTHRTPGEVFLAVQPGQAYQASVDDADLEFAILDLTLLAQVAECPPGRQLRFTGYRPASTHDTALWSNTYDYVHGTLLGGAEGRPLVVGSASRLLAATALAVFPNNALDDPTIEDRHDAHPATLRRAVAFIDANAHLDISPADIAGAAHVTIRTLQLAFRRHLDTTPMAYLRQVRLDRAHQELRSADPTTATVGAIAARWGFPNHSRFTARYHAAYGTTPSQTLRHS